MTNAASAAVRASQVSGAADTCGAGAPLAGAMSEGSAAAGAVNPPASAPATAGPAAPAPARNWRRGIGSGGQISPPRFNFVVEEYNPAPPVPPPPWMGNRPYLLRNPRLFWSPAG